MVNEKCFPLLREEHKQNLNLKNTTSTAMEQPPEIHALENESLVFQRTTNF